MSNLHIDGVSILPFHIFNDVIPEMMQKNGFEVVLIEWDEERQKFESQFTYKLNSFGLISPRLCQDKETVELIGFPIANSIISISAGVKSTNDVVNCNIMVNKENFTNIIQNFIIKLINLIKVQLDELPQELKFKIVKNLPGKSLLQMCQVNKSWGELCDDESIWKEKVKNDFGGVKVEESTWKKSYLIHLKLRHKNLGVKLYEGYYSPFPMVPLMPNFMPNPPLFTPMYDVPIIMDNGAIRRGPRGSRIDPNPRPSGLFSSGLYF